MSARDFELASETLLTAKRFRVERITQRFSNGSSHVRDVVKHPGAVVIVPVLDDGRICLIRNYRVAVDQQLIELPAGTLETGEPPLETAKRELVEETGFRAGRIEPLCEFYMSPGILDERMFAFVARELTCGDPAREPGEQIENLIVDPATLHAMITQGEIRDSKTLSTLFMFLHHGSPQT